LSRPIWEGDAVHDWEDKTRLPKPEEVTQAEMAPGEVLVYVGSLLHAGGSNFSAAPRTGVVMSYCLGWLRQSENQYFAAPPKIAKHFDKELQDMLGYCVQRPNLGMYEGGEPNILFDGKQEKTITHDWLTDEQNELIRQYYAGELTGTG
jgi:ectoine hydroxylase-related dioxygenase (phytanoyl-CoA dioxygenase family)